jgi:hypothetical protein
LEVLISLNLVTSCVPPFIPLRRNNRKLSSTAQELVLIVVINEVALFRYAGPPHIHNAENLEAQTIC